MKTSNPLVSIILCTFNRAEFLPRAIKSVIHQSYLNWELIVINDGSSDGTEKVVEHFRKQDNRIKYHFQENQGLARSRNNGASYASGEYFAFIDDDDEYTSDHIEKRVKFLGDNAQIDVIYGGVVAVGPEEKQYVPDVENPEKKIHVSQCFVSGTLFGRILVFREIGGFREIDFAEDYDFMKRVQGKYTVMKVDFPTYLYHCDAPNRLCELYEEGGEDAIREYRKGKKR